MSKLPVPVIERFVVMMCGVSRISRKALFYKIKEKRKERNKKKTENGRSLENISPTSAA